MWSRKSHFLMRCFLLRLSLLLYNDRIIEGSSCIGDSKIATVNQEDAADSNDRFSKIEAHNQNQDKEIALLKTALDKERKISRDLRNRFALLENSVNIFIDENNNFDRVKRPARLLPLQLLYGKERNYTDDDPSSYLNRFYGPATGCLELGKLGYTLNGLYLVNGEGLQPSSNKRSNQIEVVECASIRRCSMGRNKVNSGVGETRLGFITINKNRVNSASKGMPNSCSDLQQLGHSFNGFYSVIKSQPNGQGAKIETVYCDFQSPEDSKGFETRIGVVDVKSSAVQFYVERREDDYGELDQKITFLKQVLNVGGGFDWENQLFRAPYNGTYFFSISGSKGQYKSHNRANIAVKLNSEEIGQALSSAWTGYGGFSYQFTKKLKANDKIELFMLWGKTYLLYFTGIMLDEDLTI